MRSIVRPALMLCLGLALVGCESSSSLFGPGLDLQVRVKGGQVVRGPLGMDESADEGGPEVTQVSRGQLQVVRGDGTVILRGRLGAGGVALHLWAEGDEHHWITLPSGFDFVLADELLFSAELEFSHAIQTDTVNLYMQAADKDGHLGPVTVAEFDVLPDVPPSQMMVSLGWDAPVDLDLHLELPDGTVVGAKNINSNDPRTSGLTDWMCGAFLDYDSNQQCEIDAQNRENILLLLTDESDADCAPPPSGRYKVYVQLFAPCGASSVNFEAIAQLGDEVIERGAATLYEFDTRVHPAPGEVPGLLLMEFEVP